MESSLGQSIGLTEGLRDGDGPADCAWRRLEADEMDGCGRRGALVIASSHDGAAAALVYTVRPGWRWRERRRPTCVAPLPSKHWRG